MLYRERNHMTKISVVFFFVEFDVLSQYSYVPTLQTMVTVYSLSVVSQ